MACNNCNPCALNQISFDKQLLEDRELWKAKYTQIKDQADFDIRLMKQKIYEECSKIMETQFKQKQNAFQFEMTKKNRQVAQLSTKLAHAQARAIEQQSQIQSNRVQINNLQQQIKQQFQQKQNLLKQHQQQLSKMKDNFYKIINDDKIQHEQELKVIQQNNMRQIQKYKDKLVQYQNRFRGFLGEMEKLKNVIICKNKEIEELRNRGEVKEVIIQKKEKGDANKFNVIHQDIVRKLRKQLEDKDKKINKLKQERKIPPKKQVQLKTVYVDKIVQVEKIVQKIVPVEKIIKQYVQPPKPVVVQEVNCPNPCQPSPTYYPQESNQQQIDQLNEALHRKLTQIANLKSQLYYKESELKNQKQYSRDLQINIEKYKNERGNLAISERDTDIRDLQQRIREISMQKGRGSYDDKIVVNVKSDGTYTTQKRGDAKVRVSAKK